MSNETPVSTMKKLDKYFGFIEYNQTQVNYESGYQYFYNTFHGNPSVSTSKGMMLNNSKAFACSSVRKGNLAGRNYDWYYNNGVTFVIHTQPGNGLHGSIGVSNPSVSLFTDETLDLHTDVFGYTQVPFFTIDGINDAGLFITELVVPSGDKGFTRTTHPESSERELCALMMPRYILDHFATANEVANWFRTTAKIYMPNINGKQQELHYMVCDKDNSYILEIIENECKVINAYEHPFLTNFYLYGTELDYYGKPNWDTVTDYGDGLERFELIADAYPYLNTKESMAVLMRETLKYSKAYTLPIENAWKTEFVGDYGEMYGNLTIRSPLEDFIPVLNVVKEMYNNRSRETAETWHSMHSCVYDLERKELNIVVQEDPSTEKAFSIRIGEDIKDLDYYYTKDEADVIVSDLDNKKQDKLVAGDGIEITSENKISVTEQIKNTRWGSIIGDINTQDDLIELLSELATKKELELKQNRLSELQYEAVRSGINCHMVKVLQQIIREFPMKADKCMTYSRCEIDKKLDEYYHDIIDYIKYGVMKH